MTMVLSLTGSVRELALRLVRMGDSHGLVFWTFIHIRPDGTYMRAPCSYDNTPSQILWMIHKLYRRVSRTAEVPTNDNQRER
ncbi:unnamed protein product [Penicillium bialowiezense]